MSCLFIIDVQKGFVNEHTAHIPGLVEKLQYHYEHVFISQFINEDDSPYRKFIHWYAMGKEDGGVNLAFTPHPQAIIFSKTTYTCVNRLVEDYLTSRQIDTVDLCGLETEICVMATAINLFQSKIRPRVLADYCASRWGPDYHQRALDILPKLIGREQVIQSNVS